MLWLHPKGRSEVETLCRGLASSQRRASVQDGGTTRGLEDGIALSICCAPKDGLNSQVHNKSRIASAFGLKGHKHLHNPEDCGGADALMIRGSQPHLLSWSCHRCLHHRPCRWTEQCVSRSEAEGPPEPLGDKFCTKAQIRGTAPDDLGACAALVLGGTLEKSALTVTVCILL